VPAAALKRKPGRRRKRPCAPGSPIPDGSGIGLLRPVQAGVSAFSRTSLIEERVETLVLAGVKVDAELR